MRQPTAAVIGQLARDLVLTVPSLPSPGSSAAAGSRREQLGGKGASQAVALAQRSVRPSLVAVAGDDAATAAARIGRAAGRLVVPDGEVKGIGSVHVTGTHPGGRPEPRDV